MSDWRYWTLLFINMPIQTLKLLMEVALIKGIYGDESHLFSPKQWVNVYVNQGDHAIYYMTCQVEDLKDNDDLDEFLLEPTNGDGELMTVAEAKQCSQ